MMTFKEASEFIMPIANQMVTKDGNRIAWPWAVLHLKAIHLTRACVAAAAAGAEKKG